MLLRSATNRVAKMGAGMSGKAANSQTVTADIQVPLTGSDCWKCRLTPGNRCKKHRSAPSPLWLPPPSPTPYYTTAPPYSAPPTVGKFEIKSTTQPAPPYVTLHAAGGSSRPTTMPSFSSPESGTSFHYRQSNSAASPHKQVSFAPNKK